MMTGRVLTRSITFQTRQHSIFNVDLGEGVPRRALLLGLALIGVWFGLLTALFGLPSHQTLIVYVTLPAVLIYYGFQPSAHNERHTNLTRWLLKARYIAVGHRGIVNGRAAGSDDQLHARERVDLTGLAVWLTPWRPVADPWTTTRASHRAWQAGTGLNLTQTLTIYPAHAWTERTR